MNEGRGGGGRPAGSEGCGGGPRLNLSGRGRRGGGDSLKVGGANVEGACVGKVEAVLERTETRGGSAANCLKVELNIGWGVLTLASGGKMFLTVEGETVWVLRSRFGLTEFPKSCDGGGRVGRGRGVVRTGPGCPWSLAAASTSALTLGTLPSGRTSGPEKAEEGGRRSVTSS